MVGEMERITTITLRGKSIVGENMQNIQILLHCFGVAIATRPTAVLLGRSSSFSVLSDSFSFMYRHAQGLKSFLVSRLSISSLND